MYCLTVRTHQIVDGALGIAQLAPRHGGKVLCRVSGTVRKTLFPFLRGLHGVGIGIALQGMRMLFLLADQRLLVAGVRVDMAFRNRIRGFRTDQNRRLLIARLRVRVPLGFLLPTDQLSALTIALFIMRMTGGFFPAAGQNPLYLVAFVCVGMGRRPRCRSPFLQIANQRFFIALIGMVMRLLPAKSTTRQGERRKNQRVGRAEHDDAGQHRHDPSPMSFMQMFLYVPLHPLG